MTNDNTGRAPITGFKVELTLGATISINGEAWLKPGVGTSMSWGALPEQDQIETALEYMAKAILEPTLDEVMGTVIQKAKEARGITDD